MASEGSSVDLVPVWKVLPEVGENTGAILIMRDGSYRMLLRVGSVNFDMKSPTEQDGITFAFGEMLNSLSPDFPIQIVCHTKNLDTESYMRQFDRRRRDPDVPPQVRALIEDHVSHFSNQVTSRNLLQREFYVVIPHNTAPDPVGERNSDAIPMMGLFKAIFGAAESRFLGTPEEGDLDEARQQLDLRAHQIESYLGRIDIPTRRLDEREVRTLLYEFFNPDLATRQKLRGPSQGEGLFPRMRLEGPAPEARRRQIAAPRAPRRAIGPAAGAPDPVRYRAAPAPAATPATPATPAPSVAPAASEHRRRRSSDEAVVAIPLSPQASSERRRRAAGVPPTETSEVRRRRAPSPPSADDAPPPLG